MATQKARFLLRSGTAAQWASVNPVLAAGEPGYETDTGVLKLGDGITVWASLPAFERNRQAANANLTAEAGLTGAPDRVSYYTGLGAKALAAFTLAGRALVGAPDAAAQLVALGVTATAERLNTLGTYLVPVTLAANPTIDLNAGGYFIRTLAGDETFANPNNLVAGRSFQILIRQDGVGNRIVTFGAKFKFPLGGAADIGSAPNAYSVIAGYVVDTNTILASSQRWGAV